MVNCYNNTSIIHKFQLILYYYLIKCNKKKEKRNADTAVEGIQV